MTDNRVLSEQQALIYVMLTMAAANGELTDTAFARIGRLVDVLPIFEARTPQTVPSVAEGFAELMSSEDGLDVLLDMVAQALPPSLHETAYALAVEIAAADLQIQPEEIRLLELLCTHLTIDKLAAAAIERGARARLARLPSATKTDK